jgi:hypothetical protein
MSNSLSRMVKQVFASEDTREQFMSDPHSVIAGFKLTRSEKEAVLGAHAGLSAGSAEAALMVEPLAMWP